MIDELNEKDDPDYKETVASSSENKVFIIRNLGNGPTLDIQWIANPAENANPGSVWNKVGDLAVGDWSHLANAKSECMFERPKSGMIIAANEYRTTEEFRDGIFYSNCRPQNE
jgi:hypothetical protein